MSVLVNILRNALTFDLTATAPGYTRCRVLDFASSRPNERSFADRRPRPLAWAASSKKRRPLPTPGAPTKSSREGRGSRFVVVLEFVWAKRRS
jgi:hypothetical protein